MKHILMVLLVVFPIYAFSSVAFPNVAFSEIRQAPTMKNALEGADSDTLAIFDLDNTVMMPPQTLGGEEWYDYFVEKRTREFISDGVEANKAKTDAIDLGLKEWNLFHANAKVVPVENDTPELIASIQKAGTRTMALTARPIVLVDSTLRQLESIGIRMAKNTVTSKTVKIDGRNAALFKNGALLVGPKNNKGEILAKFILKTGIKPKKIIFIDNKMHHVENVEKALVSLKIPYFGRRHGAADLKISSMNKDVVETQHKYFFGEVLSDQDAKKLLK